LAGGGGGGVKIAGVCRQRNVLIVLSRRVIQARNATVDKSVLTDALCSISYTPTK